MTKLTADTITDEHITAAWKTGKLSGPDLMDALGEQHGPRIPTEGQIMAARARIAELLNARKEGKP
jgi:hypothetical protein